MKRVAIYGLGRVGTALALGLKRAHWPVSVFQRSPASRRRAAKLDLNLCGDLQQVDLVILSVPDRYVPGIRVPPGPAVVHCAGALPVSVIHQQRRGSFHPLQAVSDTNTDFSGAWVAISASDTRLGKLLREMASALAMRPLTVPEQLRAKYHAGAVMSAGLVLALIDAAVEATQLPRKSIEPALLALTASALKGALQSGISHASTGPIVRGDVATVTAHLRALKGDVRDLYRALSKRAAQRAMLSGKTRKELLRILE